MESAAHEMNLAELDNVSGGGIVELLYDIGKAVIVDTLSKYHGISDSINYIKQQAGK